jgi:FkbM family methyltransferase
MKAARRCFIDFDQYRDALRQEGDGTIDLRTSDGLVITIRRNIWDARILQEIFLNNPYVQGMTLGPQPTVVDIGGYIGDFALYAIKRLGARKVIIYEPSKKNFAIIKRNIENNHLGDRVVPVNMAVSDMSELSMDIDVADRQQVNISAYELGAFSSTRVPSVTLSDLFDTHRLESVELLKLDCEGSEYAILLGAPVTLFKRIQNIAMEYHEIDGFEEKLAALRMHLKNAGYALEIRGHIVFASRF